MGTTRRERVARARSPKTTARESGRGPDTRGVKVSESPTRLMATNEVAAYLGISRRSVLRLVGAGDLRPIRLSRGPRARLRFEVRDVEELIEARKVPA